VDGDDLPAVSYPTFHEQMRHVGGRVHDPYAPL
jgi:hypothetical protein